MLLARVLTLKNAPAPSLFNAINGGGQSHPAHAAGFPQETSPPFLFLCSAACLSVILAMALDSVPPYPCDLGSSRAATARTQQRISSKDERTWTSDTYAPYDDGHQWRKYGEKKLSNSNFPRFYYRCINKNDMKCPATKQVQQKDTSDPLLFSVTFFNHHTCSSSSNPLGGSARDAAAQPSSKKAVSISFCSHASSNPPSFLTPPRHGHQPYIPTAVPASNSLIGTPMCASSSGPACHLRRAMALLRWRLMSLRREAETLLCPAAPVLCRGRCCRSANPGVLSSSISCDGVQGRSGICIWSWRRCCCRRPSPGHGRPEPSYTDP